MLTSKAEEKSEGGKALYIRFGYCLLHVWSEEWGTQLAEIPAV